MTKNYCDQCDKEMGEKEDCFELSNGYVCSNCYMDAISRAENAYDMARDEGRI